MGCIKRIRHYLFYCKMGCICSKGAQPDEPEPENVEPQRGSKPLVNSSRREQQVVNEVNGSTRPKTRSPMEENAYPTPVFIEEVGKKQVADSIKAPNHQRRATVDIGADKEGEQQLSRLSSMPHGPRGEQIVAGWPSWLTSVAGEAIQGWVPRRADSFEKLDKIGQGTYSTVYKARDLENGKIVALKKVRFVNMDPESVRFMAREIYIMRKLDHPNVLKLQGLVTSRLSGSLYLVFEYMEHDLAGLAALSGVRFTESQIKCYMKQLLEGLKHCHSRGVLHRDIKGSNLLVDDKGILRIADFGLATCFEPDKKQPLTSRVVTLWYRPPELLLGATEYDVAVDLWSSGCILAELLAGKPIMPGRTEVEQLHKIFKLCGSPSEEYWKKSKLPNATIFKPQHPYRRRISETFKEFPSSSVALLDVLLAVEPEKRGSAASALRSEFFTTAPLPCDPSKLPKYAPSKELDAKRLNEEAKRQKAAAGKDKNGSKDSKPGENAKMQQDSNPKSISDKYNIQEDSGSGFPIEPSRGPMQNVPHSSHPRATGATWSKKVKEEESLVRGTRAFGSGRSCEQMDNLGSRSAHPRWPEKQSVLRFNRLDDVEHSEKSEWSHQSSHKQSERIPANDSTRGYRPKKNRIHYSGPLMAPGSNMEDMLKEHERQIQEAVRKARLDKVKN